jgi:hypothetical protein
MSILSELAHGRITFHQAASEAEQWASQVVAHDPILSGTAATLLTDVKQAASDAIGMADSALGQFIMPAAATVEGALDAALAKATGGVSIPFNHFVNDGIDKFASAVKAEADAWALKAKAQLASPAPAAPAAPPA